jgi:hypothetical protein
VSDACFAIELLDFVGDTLGIARPISPALDVPVGAVDAFVDAAALRLNWNRRAMTLIAREIDPPVKRWRWK